MPESLSMLRRRVGWTQAAVAQACGLTQPLVSLAERGRASEALTHRIAQVLAAETERQAREAEDTTAMIEAQRREEADERAAAAAMETLAAAIPDGAAWRALRAAIKERALDHLDHGRPEACDALLEMIPSDEAVALLTTYCEGAPAESAGPTGEPDDTLDATDPTLMTLADRITAFLDRHACIRRSYVAGEDDPDERFNGPDTAMMASAAELLRKGERPHVVQSNWSMSGCYRVPADRDAARAGEIEHDALVAEINRMARETA